MCGIGGFSLSVNENFYKNELDEIISRIDHRGPDDKGFYENQKYSIGLVHTRLSIQDPSSLGHQPMISEDKNIVLVFNGEIYNFIELRSELIKKGVKFKSNSDTEVLLNLYMLEGKEMLTKLNGIFAFAIWDQRSKSLFIARDHFGVKPIYYASLKDRFYFASELKAILPALKENKNLDQHSLQEYMTFLFCPGSGTPFKSIKKLLPGEAMIVFDGKIQKKWKWYLLPIFKNKSKKLMNKEFAIEGIRKHFRTAVSRQMLADVPVGAFLSGGLDSSAVVSYAREQNKDIRCFTIESQGWEKESIISDLPYARRVAKYLKVPLDIVQINPNNIVDDLVRMVKIMDEPIPDPSALNVFYISKLAREQGIKVLLSGAGGDDIFTGYRRHYALMTEHWWDWLPFSAKRFLSDISSKLNQKSLLNRRLAKLFSGATLSGNNRMVNYFHWIKRTDLQKLFSSEFRSTINNEDADSTMIDFLESLPSKTTKLERMLALEQQYFLPDLNLLYTDKMSMAAGVEVRVPFLDKELVEFVHNIPDYLKQNGREGKWILKKALENNLPNDIIYRPKTGFGVPLRSWIRNELRELIEDILSTTNLKNRGIFDPSTVQKLILDNQTGKIDASYTLLSLLCLEIWFKEFL